MGRFGVGWKGGTWPQRSVGQSHASRTSPCPPSNHTRIEHWDRAEGKNTLWKISKTNEVHNGKWMRAARKTLEMSHIHPFGRRKGTRIIWGNPWF